MGIIEARDVKKVYGEGQAAVQALRGVDVSFTEGEFTAIMGPSGSGKSTLMHVLAGLDRLSGGEVLFAGRPLSRMGDNELTLLRREEIGFIFQSFNLLPMFTAEQNIRMPLTLAGKRADEQWFQELASVLQIESRLTHRPSELSGGQQQRMAIARALISKPKVIFADEPTGNLDSVTSKDVLQLLRKLVDRLGQTVVMVTHDPVAATYADRVLILADGDIVAERRQPRAEELSQLLLRLMEESRQTGAAKSSSAGLAERTVSGKEGL